MCVTKVRVQDVIRFRRQGTDSIRLEFLCHWVRSHVEYNLQSNFKGV